jgi:hypothetical protein
VGEAEGDELMSLLNDAEIEVAVRKLAESFVTQGRNLSAAERDVVDAGIDLVVNLLQNVNAIAGRRSR